MMFKRTDVHELNFFRDVPVSAHEYDLTEFLFFYHMYVY